MKVFITRIIPDAGLQVLRDAGISYTEWTELRHPSQEELITACKEHDALLSVGPNKLDAYFFEQCSHLKAISLFSVGYDNVDLVAAKQYNIPVGHTPGVLSGATADVAFLLLLAVSRKAFYHHDRIAKGDWDFFEPTLNLGQDLNGKTLGIFGLGRIGTALAKKCKGAYSMKIIYHNRNRNEEAEKELDATYVSFDELILQSDVVSVHTDLSASTKGLFNAAVFSKMKPSSIFINTARGAIHHEPDLISALQNGTIWGAGLDVTNPEPMAPDNPLLSMPNACVLPHIGSGTQETRNAMAVMTAGNIADVLAGKKMKNEIPKG